MKYNVVWIRKDLRLDDNKALIEALNYSYENHDKLILLVCLDTKEVDFNKASYNYYLSALNVFYNNLLKLNLDIYFLYGNAETEIKKFINQMKIKNFYFNLVEVGYENKQDIKIINLLKEHNIEVFPLIDKHLNGANYVLKDDFSYYKVFTPYYKKWMFSYKPESLKIDYDKLKLVVCSKIKYKNSKNKFFELLDKREKLFDSICGEERAEKVLDDFIEEKLNFYEKDRDLFYKDGTSNLSQFLASGEISIRKVYNKVVKSKVINKESFIRELAWRDFYNMIYYFNKDQHNKEIIEKYRNLKWNNDKNLFNKWVEGKTGFPLIDAAMICLKKTNLMPNRLRMVVSSFLVKDLLIDWRLGEDYFSRMLIDYDCSSNIGGWQWAASVGCDASPYFRVFNPITQSKKFDKNGLFIRKYIPQLKDIDSKFIHDPSSYSKQILEKNNINISKSYTTKIVDHQLQRQRAIQMFKLINK